MLVLLVLVTADDRIQTAWFTVPLTKVGVLIALPRYTFKCDTWSLGVVVFRMLNGHLPFQDLWTRLAVYLYRQYGSLQL